jgi:hypothetical protein
MKMKFNPRPKQKMKLSAKLIIGGCIVAAAALVLVKNQQGLPTVQKAASSFNSGRCLTFNGTSSDVTFSSNDPGLGSGNKMTVTAWVKWSSKTGAGNWANVVAINKGSGSSGDDGQFWLQHNTDNSAFEFAVENNSSVKSYATSTTNPSIGVWYHVAGVYDGSYINIYVNGIRESRTAFTGNINNFQGSFKLVFGKWANSSDSYRRFKGDIDEVSLWNKALSQTEVRDIMCEKLAGTESGLVGYWRMNEASGSSVKDGTSNGRHGTSANTTVATSGAPVGDASKYVYGGTSIGLSNYTYHDSVNVNGFSSTPTGIHIFCIDTNPNYTTLPSGYASFASGYYFGVFIVNASGETYNFTYHYTGNPGASTPGLLGVVTRVNNTVTSWSDLSATTNTTSGTLTKTGLTGRSEFALAIKGVGGLPIELTFFSAETKESLVEIKWETATEINNDFFTVERTSDGVNFEAIAKAKGAGNSAQSNTYVVTDNHPLDGLSYYRLRQTDYDGKTETFNLTPVEVAKKKQEGFEIVKTYPNPFSERFTVDINSKNETQIKLELINLEGKVVYTKTAACYEGMNMLECDPNGSLPDGNYILNLFDENENKKSVKLVKKN